MAKKLLSLDLQCECCGHEIVHNRKPYRWECTNRKCGWVETQGGKFHGI